jgi:hypothetical protein
MFGLCRRNGSSLWLKQIINCCLFLQSNSIIQGGKLAQLVDPNLPTEGHTDEVERMTLAASLCIRQAPQNRPQIDVVSFSPS